MAHSQASAEHRNLGSVAAIREGRERGEIPRSHTRRAERFGLHWWCALAALLDLGLVSAAPGIGREPAPKPASSATTKAPADAKHYEDQVRPFLVRHCLECHGSKKPKGGLRLDQIPPDFTDTATRERWLAVLKRRGIAILEATTGNELATLQAPHQPWIRAFCFSRDASNLVALQADQSLQVWDLRGLRRELAALKLDW